MTASLAAEMGFAVDEIDELRMAVDEIVTAVVDVTDEGAPVEVRFSVGTDELVVRVGSDSTVDLDAEADPLIRRILAAVTDRYELGVGGASVHRRRDGT
jgi:anti-sigma regulatory factor (Ser/Thr protein kinase)